MEPGQSLFERWPTMAEDLGHSRQRVHYWRTTRRIPADAQQNVLQTAQRLGLAITAEDVVFPFPEDRAA